MTLIKGICKPDFDLVRQAFSDHFSRFSVRGAAVSVYLRGEVAVNLWGGFIDTQKQKPWQKNTLVNVFSVGKPFIALALLKAFHDNRLSLDQPVAKYWPEFASAGKEKITVQGLLSHQSGIPAVRALMKVEDLLDWDFCVRTLEKEAPWWDPGSTAGEQAVFYGYGVGELIRRVTGSGPSEYFHENIAKPFELDLYFGVPASEISRVTDLWFRQIPSFGCEPGKTKISAQQVNNPPVLDNPGFVNSAEFRKGVIPAINGHSHAETLAKFYAVMGQALCGEGSYPLERDILLQAASVQYDGFDEVLGESVKWCLGFQKGEHGSVGHAGLGGFDAFCHPETGIAYSYVSNSPDDFTQSEYILDALRSSINNPLV